MTTTQQLRTRILAADLAIKVCVEDVLRCREDGIKIVEGLCFELGESLGLDFPEFRKGGGTDAAA